VCARSLCHFWALIYTTLSAELNKWNDFHSKKLSDMSDRILLLEQKAEYAEEKMMNRSLIKKRIRPTRTWTTTSAFVETRTSPVDIESGIGHLLLAEDA
jgi:hypothetical protein